jgi:hypothetical protein
MHRARALKVVGRSRLFLFSLSRSRMSRSFPPVTDSILKALSGLESPQQARRDRRQQVQIDKYANHKPFTINNLQEEVGSVPGPSGCILLRCTACPSLRNRDTICSVKGLGQSGVTARAQLSKDRLWSERCRMCWEVLRLL